MRKGTQYLFVGLNNYAMLFQSVTFWKSLSTTAAIDDGREQRHHQQHAVLRGVAQQPFLTSKGQALASLILICNTTPSYRTS